ncbi:MAG: hypothetical protein PCFJNLEI_02504 [Verrucomicrobiae bacterium]|nr:hypothetical protein [Verrucomicrobiae bacterium]
MVAPVKTILLFLAIAGTAFADVNLFNDGTWLIDGAEDPATNASSIQLFIDKEPVGSFSELKFYYNTGSNNFAQVYSITGSGTFAPSLPPPSEPGGVFRLASYWDCEQGLIGTIAVTELGWKSKPNKKGLLELTGKLANQNSMETKKMKLSFLPVASDYLRLELDFDLVATRDFCVDLTKHPTQQQFRVVTMYSNFVSLNEHANDLARYTKITEKNCAGIYGCSTKKESFCIALTNAPAGQLINASRRLGETRMLLAHTTEGPRLTPGLAVAYFSPGPGRIKPQGLFEPTDDPAAENIQFWGNWVDAKKQYKQKQKVGRFRVALEATWPKSLNCDTLQTPAQ